MKEIAEARGEKNNICECWQYVDYLVPLHQVKLLFILCKNYANRRSSLVSKSLPIKKNILVTCLFAARNTKYYVLQGER